MIKLKVTVRNRAGCSSRPVQRRSKIDAPLGKQIQERAGGCGRFRGRQGLLGKEAGNPLQRAVLQRRIGV